MRPNDGRSISQTVSLNILVHDVINLLYIYIYIHIEDLRRNVLRKNTFFTFMITLYIYIYRSQPSKNQRLMVKFVKT